jgi:hypothetical protein
MTMEEWAKRIDRLLEFDDREILRDKGSHPSPRGTTIC